MVSHFWWRPGWAPDRPYLTWHVLPDPDLVARVHALRTFLTGFGHLAVVEPERLHATGPGVGFEDALDPGAVETMVAAAARSVASLAPFTADVGAPDVGRTGVALPVDGARLTSLRHTLRAAVRTAGLVPPGADHEAYRPHVTLAYASGPGSRSEVASRVATVPWAGARLRVTSVHLLALRMLPAAYDWEVRGVVRLGG